MRRRLCLAAAVTSRRHRAIFSRPGVSATARADTIGQSSAAPSSAAFSTRKSIRGPLIIAAPSATVRAARRDVPRGCAFDFDHRLPCLERSYDSVVLRAAFVDQRDARAGLEAHHVAQMMELVAAKPRDAAADRIAGNRESRRTIHRASTRIITIVAQPWSRPIETHRSAGR